MALPDYLQDTAKDFAKQLTATTSVPIDTTKFTGRQFVGGEDLQSFKQDQIETVQHYKHNYYLKGLVKDKQQHNKH
jgi:hypothetical protein